MQILALATGLALAFALASCLFDSRDAAPPSGPGSGGCTLESPQKAFACMTNALASGTDGDYDRSISDNFIFSPTIADSLDQAFIGTMVYDGWDKQVEMDVLRLMLAESNQTLVDFGSPSVLINKNTFVRYNVSYSLRVVETATPADTTVYKGVAQIDVRNENGNWRVTFWNETETVAGFSTWGYLRGILRLRT